MVEWEVLWHQQFDLLIPLAEFLCSSKRSVVAILLVTDVKC
jgi:hypothetical protein